MAIPVNVDDLINHRVVESTRIEFKADFNPAPIIRSICAFANDILLMTPSIVLRFVPVSIETGGLVTS